MFRLFKDQIQHILLALVYLRYVAVLTSNRAIKDALAVWMRANPNGLPQLTRDWVTAVSREMGDHAAPPSPDEVVDVLIAQLATPREAKADKDLIDAIVESLGLPFTGGRYTANSDRTRAVQRALLTPNEVGLLRDKLRKAEMLCGACNVPLRDNELVTFSTNGGPSPVLYCYRCLNPQWVGCHTCRKGVQAIDRKFYIGSTTVCEDHKPKPTGLAGALRVKMPDPATFTIMDDGAFNPMTGAVRAVPTGIEELLMPTDPLEEDYDDDDL